MKMDNKEIQKLLQRIRDKSNDGDYIYRGETQEFPEISSTLYRKHKNEIAANVFNINTAQTKVLEKVKDYISFDKDIDPLTELQHYGGKTNLIDFSTDYLVALFFACDAEYNKDDAKYNKKGRLILLNKNTYSENITTPTSKNVRIISQKSIFFQPPKGFIAEEKVKIITINQKLKQPILRYLKKYHRITTASIYNDLFGYIQNQDKHQDADTQFYIGLTHYYKAEKQQQAGKHAEAQEEYNKAIIAYTAAIEFKPDNAEAYNNRGLAKAGLKQYQKAITDYNKAIKLNPDDATAYNNRGNAKADLGQHKKAITDYNTAIELKPDVAEAYYNRGNAKENLRQYLEAIADHTAAIKLNPDYAGAYNNRGLAKANLGRHPEAIIDYTEAIKLNPDHAKAYNNRGIAKAALKQYQEAIIDYNAAIKLNPDYAAAYNNRGVAKADLGQHQQALGQHQKALEQYPEAIIDYTTAIELNPDDAAAYISRGLAKERLGQYQQARADYTEAMNLAKKQDNQAFIDIMNQALINLRNKE